jgi:hypothetical protein
MSSFKCLLCNKDIFNSSGAQIEKYVSIVLNNMYTCAQYHLSCFSTLAPNDLLNCVYIKDQMDSSDKGWDGYGPNDPGYYIQPISNKMSMVVGQTINQYEKSSYYNNKQMKIYEQMIQKIYNFDPNPAPLKKSLDIETLKDAGHKPLTLDEFKAKMGFRW